MIGKIPRPGKGFRGSFNYLMHGKREEHDPERLAWMETRNLFVDDPDRIPSMMRATAAQSKKCQKPVYHMIISWRPDEAPSDVTMREVADRALFDLGLNEHQAVLAAHRDTNHRHLHILVNRVHPETGKAWHTSKDWARFERSIARQALERGLIKVDGRHNTPEKMARENKRARDSEYQLHKRLGREMPQDRWSVEEIKSRRKQLVPIFEQARSWDHLTRLLDSEGLTVTAKGQGLVIDDGMGFMKLSDLGKDVRLAGLETLYRERFADFALRREMEQAHAEKSPTPQPPDPAVPAEASRAHAPSNAPSPYPRQLADESENDKLRAQWRATRQHAHQQPAAADDDNESASAAPPPHRDQHPHHPRTENASLRKEAWRKVMEARERLDLARELHRGGMIDNDDLGRAIENHASTRDDLAQLMQDEPDKVRLREEWRQQSEAQRDRLRSRPPQQPSNAGDADTAASTATEAPPQRQLQQTPKPAASPPSPRLEAFRNLSHAHEQLNLARQLHELGIISKQDMIKARDSVTNARDELAKHQTFSEFVSNGVREALSSHRTPAPAAVQPEKKPKPPPSAKPHKQVKTRDRKQERDRDR